MDLREAMRNANALMHLHGLDSQGWRVEYDRAVRSFGACHFRSKRITLSRVLTETATAEQVRNTMLHEIAHALVGGEAGHGPVWRAMHRRIGGTGERVGRATTEQLQAITYRWVGKCPQGHEFKRHRLTKALKANGLCLRCSYRVDRRISWVDTSVPAR